MEKMQLEIEYYSNIYDESPQMFLKRIIAGFFNIPELLRRPDYKRLYDESFKFLEWFYNKYYIEKKDIRQVAVNMIPLLCKNSRYFAYDYYMIKGYLAFRRKIWKLEE